MELVSSVLGIMFPGKGLHFWKKDKIAFFLSIFFSILLMKWSVLLSMKLPVSFLLQLYLFMSSFE